MFHRRQKAIARCNVHYRQVRACEFEILCSMPLRPGYNATGIAFIVVRYYGVSYHKYMIRIPLETLNKPFHAHVSCLLSIMGLFLIPLQSLNKPRSSGLSGIRSPVQIVTTVSRLATSLVHHCFPNQETTSPNPGSHGDALAEISGCSKFSARQYQREAFL